jgi:hypothetical protein
MGFLPLRTKDHAYPDPGLHLHSPRAYPNIYTEPRRGGFAHRPRREGDAAAKAPVKRPAAACVEKVYEEGNFAGLRIGT